MRTFEEWKSGVVRRPACRRHLHIRTVMNGEKRSILKPSFRHRQPVGIKKTLTESCGGVVIISRILTLQNFNSGERQSRNIYIPLSPSSRFSSTAGQGGPPGVAIRPLSHCNGVLVALQRTPRCNAVRPLRQDFRPDFIAHFHWFRRNVLYIRQ